METVHLVFIILDLPHKSFKKNNVYRYLNSLNLDESSSALNNCLSAKRIFALNDLQYMYVTMNSKVQITTATLTQYTILKIHYSIYR